MKILRFVALLVWMVAGAGYGMHDYYKLKKDCIQSEGFFKGWLWCSQETNHSFAFSMLKGAAWPYFLLRPKDADALSNDSKGEDLNRSPVYMMYVCWSLATKLDKKEDANVLSKSITYFRGIDNKLDRQHSFYLGSAANEIIALESQGDIKNFYHIGCSEPVTRMSQAVDQGMFK